MKYHFHTFSQHFDIKVARDDRKYLGFAAYKIGIEVLPGVCPTVLLPWGTNRMGHSKY